jgi:hypothetical protein
VVNVGRFQNFDARSKLNLLLYNLRKGYEFMITFATLCNEGGILGDLSDIDSLCAQIQEFEDAVHTNKKSLEEVDLPRKEIEDAGRLREKLHKAKEDLLPPI